MIESETALLLRSLSHALADLADEFKREIMSEKLAGNIVKQARAEGSLYCCACVTGAITDFIKAQAMDSAAANAAKDPRSKDYLREMAKVVQAKLPDNFGFLLLAAPFGAGPGRLVYTSTMNREDAIRLLKEWLLKAGGAEEWMKHLD